MFLFRNFVPRTLGFFVATMVLKRSLERVTFMELEVRENFEVIMFQLYIEEDALLRIISADF